MSVLHRRLLRISADASFHKTVVACLMLATSGCGSTDSAAPPQSTEVLSASVSPARNVIFPVWISDTITVAAVVRDGRGSFVPGATVSWSIRANRALPPGVSAGTITTTGPLSAVVQVEVEDAIVEATPVAVRGGITTSPGQLRISAEKPVRAFVWSRLRGFSVLPSLPTEEVYPLAINDRGQVVGTASTRNSYDLRAFFWSDSSGYVFLNGATFAGASAATAINNSGAVTGWTNADGTVSRAFVWTRTSGLSVAVGLPLDAHADGISINSSGSIVGHVRKGNATRGFKWSPPAAPVFLPMPLGDTHSEVVTINDRGQMLGYRGKWEDPSLASARRIPVLWNPDESITSVADCDAGCDLSVAALNVRGQIAGTLGSAAFRRSASGEIVRIPLPGEISRAVAMNDEADIVGHSEATSPSLWLWTAAGEVVRIALPAGTNYAELRGINNKGEVVGWFR